MIASARPGPPPAPRPELARRTLGTHTVAAGSVLFRIHRSRYEALHFGRDSDPERRQRWDAPDASYGVCYMTEEAHVAFAETLLRDPALDVIHQRELEVRSLARVRVCSSLRLVAMHGRHLRSLGADASVVQGPYPNTWAWSAAFHAHPDTPDGIYYRARHDDSGFSVALFERARAKVEHTDSTGLLDSGFARELARWLDQYGVGLTS